MKKTLTLIVLLNILQISFASSCTGQTKPKDRITAIVHVNLIPMTRAFEDTRKNQTIIVENDKIKSIGPSASINIPRGAKVINGKELYLMPGLADMHMHFPGEGNDEFILKMYLVNGVTTIRSLNGSEYQKKLRKKVISGIIPGPTIYLSGPIIGEKSGSMYFRSTKRVEKEIQKQSERGYDCIKLYTFLPADVYRAGMQKAKRLNLYTVGHIPYSVGLDGVIKEGMDEIAHIEELLYEFLVDFDRNNPNPFGLEIDYSRLENIMQKVKNSNIILCTSLAIDEVIVQKIIAPREYLARPEAKYLPGDIYNQIAQYKDHHQVLFGQGKEMLDWIKLYKKILVKAKELDIPLICGTDAGAYGVIHGYSLHDELRIMTQNGFSPFEAIYTATKGASLALNKQNQWGTIEVGKRADMILLEKNPLRNIKNLKKIRGIMAFGNWYSKEKLQEML